MSLCYQCGSDDSLDSGALPSGDRAETAGVFDALYAGCCTGTEHDDDSDSAIPNFPQVASRSPSLLLEFFLKMLASKASLRRWVTTVVSRVQRFHVALAEKTFVGSGRLAQEFLATEHWHFELLLRELV